MGDKRWNDAVFQFEKAIQIHSNIFKNFELKKRSAALQKKYGFLLMDLKKYLQEMEVICKKYRY